MKKGTESVAGKIAELIRREVMSGFSIDQCSEVSGGSINRCFMVANNHHSFFVKTNSAHEINILVAESDGLRKLRGSSRLLVPEPLASGVVEDLAILILPLMDLSPLSRSSAALLGSGLAEQHLVTEEYFGLQKNNFIGLTDQANNPNPDWINFFSECRLAPQFAMASARGGGHALSELGEKLMDSLPAFFTQGPVPSLLHGDLWCGNTAQVDGRPAVFDPAVYFGDREADIAMTELFGGFPDAFYDAYNAAWELQPEYRVRKHLYNLYHILNHFNLFGGGYSHQAEQLTRRLLAEV